MGTGLGPPPGTLGTAPRVGAGRRRGFLARWAHREGHEFYISCPGSFPEGGLGGRGIARVWGGGGMPVGAPTPECPDRLLRMRLTLLRLMRLLMRRSLPSTIPACPAVRCRWRAGRSGSVREEVQHEAVETVRVFPLCPVAAAVEHVQLRVGDAPDQP